LTKQTEALKLALEALENPWKAGPDGVAEAITAIKKALAQHEERYTYGTPLMNLFIKPAQEPQPVKLHEAVISAWSLREVYFDEDGEPSMHRSPPAAQPAQEPVAWMTINEYGEEDDIHYENPEGHLLEGWTYKPLYTTPQPVQEESPEPFEYWNAVEGWVKIEEVRKHFGSVGCGTIYKTAGEDRVPLYTTPQQQEPRNFCSRCGKRTADLTVIHTCTPPEGGFQ
jgi:hypothetical protein